MKETFRKSVIAGILIAIEDFVYMNAENKIVASFLFPLALCTIIITHMNLYTGKIGLAEPNWSSIGFLITVYIGNVLGTMILLPFYSDSYSTFMSMKISQNLWNVFGEAMFCGMLMYIAVVMGSKNPLYTILGVASFLIGKCEHCIADWGYIMASHSFDANTMIFISVATIGNSLGAILIHRLFRESDFK